MRKGEEVTPRRWQLANLTCKLHF